MLKNTPTRYGLVTKTLHWVMFLVIVNQFAAAWMMLNTPDGTTTAGFTQGTLYEWHKSIGLIALVLVVVRYAWRRAAGLPDWSPSLGARERQWVEGIERALYLCLFVMPVSGYVFVMAGGYGVQFLDRWPLPNPIGEHPDLASAADWTHYIAAIALSAALIAHWGLALRHWLTHRDRYVHRMLPFTHED